MADPSSLVIEELTGRKRKVTLRGRALPYRGPAFPGEMRAEFTHYPGNPIATVQVLGPKEGETTFEGMWKDRFIKALIGGQPEGVALLSSEIGEVQAPSTMDLVKAIDSIRRSGQLIRMTWDEITRDGILMSFVPKFDRREDVSWEMKFQWVSQADAPAPVAGVGGPDTTNLASAMDADVSEIITAFHTIVAAAAEFTAAADTQVRSMQTAITGVADTVRHGVDAVLTPAAVARRVAGLLQFSMQTAKGLQETLEQTPVADLVVGGVPSAGARIAAELGKRQMKDAARTARNRAAYEQCRYEDQLGGTTILAVLHPIEGQDLRAVSTRYYGTPDEWRMLMAFNGLSDSYLHATDVVVVPKLGG